jgi:serine/threonine-protein kinase
VQEGQILGGRYRLERHLGSGGMSLVWQARDELLGRDVAVKMLAQPYATDPAFDDAVRAEAMAAASISHPHVTSVFDFGVWSAPADDSGATERAPYVVMELLEGRSLSDRLGDGPLPPDLALRVCAQVAGALAAAHARGVVHRDVKPGNVILTPTGAKVFDFGLAASVGQEEPPRPDRVIFGTPAYLAPERLAGAVIGPASDLYALGLLLYRLLTDDLPWPADTVTEMVHAHTYVEPGPLPDLQGVPDTVADLYRRCLSKEPSGRPSAHEAALTLAAAAGIPAPVGEATVSTTPASTTPASDVADTDGEAVPVAARTATAGPPPAKRRTRHLHQSWVLIAAAGGALAVIVALLLAAASSWSGHPGNTSAPGTKAPSQAPGLPGAGPSPQYSGSRTGGPRTPGASGSPLPGVPAPPRPIGTPPATSGPGDGPTSGPSTTVLTSVAGTVRAGCNGKDAFLSSWTPGDGYRVQTVKPGPAPTAKVKFKGKKVSYVLSVTCDAGTPVLAVKTA